MTYPGSATEDRSRNGGGVFIFSRNSINYKIKHDLIPPELECVCIEIIKPHSRLFLVSKVYRPMTTSSLIDHIVTNTPEKISDSGVIHAGMRH